MKRKLITVAGEIAVHDYLTFIYNAHLLSSEIMGNSALCTFHPLEPMQR